MSAYKVIRTEFKNFTSLVKAVEDLGYKDHFFTAKDLKNPDLQLVDYLGKYRPEKASLRIPRQFIGPLSNDVGFVWDASTRTYQAIISNYDQNGKWGEEQVNRLRQRYAFHEVKRQAKAQGYAIKEVATENGAIRLQLTRR